MSVSLLTTPAERALCRGGQTTLTLAGNARQLLAGVAARNVLLLIDSPKIDDTVILNWNGTRLILTCTADANDPLGFPPGNGSVAYLNSLIPYFGTLQAIRADFTVTVGVIHGSLNVLVFTARKTGQAYTFINENGIGGHTAGPDLPGVDAKLRPQYGAWVNLRVQKEGTAAALGTTLDPDTDFFDAYQTTLEADKKGLMPLDLAPLLEGYLTPALPKTGQFAAQASAQRSYYVEYAECYGSPLIIGRVSRDSIRTVYLGGATHAGASGSGFSLTDFVQGVPHPADPGTDRALRYGPLSRYVSVDSPQWLTWLNTRTPRAIVGLRVDLVFSDGQHQLKSDSLAPAGFGLGGTLTAGVGPAQLGILPAAGSGMILSSYTVTLTDMTTAQALSLPYRFIIDYRPRPYARPFLFVNSLGAFDTLTSYGKGSGEWNRVSQQAERAQFSPYDATEGSQQAYGILLQDTVGVTTGFLDATQIRAWRDLYRSPWIWAWPSVAGTAPVPTPVVLDLKSVKQGKDGDNLTAHTFAYASAFSEAYSDELSTNVPAYDPPVPAGFAPAGTVVVQPQPTVIEVVDKTISAAVRSINPDDVLDIRLTKSWGNHKDGGYLNQQLATDLFETKPDADAGKSALQTDLLALRRLVSTTQTIRVRAVPRL